MQGAPFYTDTALCQSDDDSEFQRSDPAASSHRFLSAPVGPACADPVAADGNTITTASFVDGRGGDGSRLLPYSTGGEVRSRPPCLPIKQLQQEDGNREGREGRRRGSRGGSRRVRPMAQQFQRVLLGSQQVGQPKPPPSPTQTFKKKIL